MKDLEWKVYFIRAGMKEKDPVKVGYTSNLERRFYEIQVCNPYKLRLLCAIPCESKEHAQKLEKFLHKHLRRGNNIHGEWFDISNRSIPKLVDSFTEFYRQSSNFPDVEFVSGKSFNMDLKKLQKENENLKKEVTKLQKVIKKMEQDQEEFLDLHCNFQKGG